MLDDTADMESHGVQFGKPTIDLKKIVEWKNSVVKRLTGGLKALAKQRKVQIIAGNGKFISANELEVTNAAGEKEIIKFENAIIGFFFD